MAELETTRNGSVQTLILSRVDQRNALSASLVEKLIGALDEAERNDDTRVIVLTGAGEKAFCAGGDLSGSGDTPGFLAQHDGRRRYGKLLERLVSLEKPVVARINGHALAGGLGLVCACDLAISTDDAWFGTPEINVGLFPYMVTTLLFRQIAPKHASELVLTGERIDANQAVRIGLVNRAVPRATLDEAVGTLVDKLAAKSPAVLRLGKRALKQTRDLALAPALELLAAQLSINVQTEDAAEGISAFLEKRPPEWTGR